MPFISVLAAATDVRECIHSAALVPGKVYWPKEQAGCKPVSAVSDEPDGVGAVQLEPPLIDNRERHHRPVVAWNLKLRRLQITWRIEGPSRLKLCVDHHVSIRIVSVDSSCLRPRQHRQCDASRLRAR